MTINPYLTFNGNCEEAFNYYKSVFGGEFSVINRFSEMPPNEDMPLSEEHMNLIMHVSLPLGEGQVLMGSDNGGEWAPELVPGNHVTLSVDADSREKADAWFAKLSEGGQVAMPMAETFWGSYFGMCVDRFGFGWMIAFGESM